MKNSFSKKLSFAALAAVVAITACTKSDHPGYEKADNGLYYKFYKQDEKGVKPKEGDVVKLTLKWKNSKDSTLFDSTNPKYNPSGKTTIEFPLQKSTFKGSFEDALMMMAVGDSASFLINADSVYLATFKAKELPPYIQKGTVLTFETTLLKVTSKDEVEKERQKQIEEQKVMMEARKGEEAKTLAKYLEDNKITTKPTADGLYYIEKTKGKGGHPSKGDQVKVNYILSLIDGKMLETTLPEAAKAGGIFDEKRPYAPAEYGIGQLIPGMDEGLLMMSKGSKVKLIIPSSIGYGEGNQGIPPYTTLVFEVELIDFHAAPANQGPPMPPTPTR
ncbi:MAG: Peptidylprolyl isomerase [Bacteroidetes bacterium]|nr:Peptidylprolyl isomerase [Bacteroidota bacterium]